MNQQTFLSLISGQKKGVHPAACRLALSLLEPFYAGATSVRNRLFDVGIKKAQRVSCPIVSVGNITTGGTGKTPTVAWLVKSLLAEGIKPAILSRGYQSLDGEANDEKLLLEQLCPTVPHLQNRDRVAGAQTIIDQSQPDVIILDDGFQHRRLHRDFDLVLVDALNPFGYGHLLPRGLLRETLSGLKRASAILITRCNQVTEEQLRLLQKQLADLVQVPIFSSEFAPTGLINSSGQRTTFAEMNGKRTCSFAGIGNPAGFRRSLASVGLAVSDKSFLSFPDHHHYSSADLKRIHHWSRERNAEALIVTQKDLVKINADQIGPIPVWALEIELSLRDSAGDHLIKLIQTSADQLR